MIPSIDLDLGAPPAARWPAPLTAHTADARALVDFYLRDLGAGRLESWEPLIEAYRATFVAPELRAELDAVARAIGRSPTEALVANIYYDAFRVLMGCTAFAVDTPTGPIHARNLDWWTDRGLLSRATWIVRASGGRAVGPYSTVGWPGFIGAFSGVAKGRFAITMNAVLSEERAEPRASIAFLIRDVLETAKSYGEAVERLTRTPIAPDCLLLVTGVRQGEMVVIERTPTRGTLRSPEKGLLVVTNDYRLGPSRGTMHGELTTTSCARFDRAAKLARERRPTTAGECMGILSDKQVKMGITVQHMVMRAATGELVVELPR